MEVKIAELERQAKGLRQSIADRERSERRLEQRLDELTQGTGSPKKGATSGTIRTRTSKKTQNKVAPQGEKRLHKVQPGDTLYRISRQYGITVEELCRLNNISPNDVIKTGQRLFVPSRARQ